MSNESINLIKAKESNNTIDKKKDFQKNTEIIAFTKAINKNFNTFSDNEKKQLLQLILSHCKLAQNQDKRQVYVNIVKEFYKQKSSPTVFLKKLEIALKRTENDIQNIKKPHEKLYVKPINKVAPKILDRDLSKENISDKNQNEKANTIIKKTKEAYQKLAPQYKPQSQEQLQAKLSQL